METPEINTQLLDRVREAIQQNPKNTNMDDFVGHKDECGTTYCIAGWIVAVGNPGYLSSPQSTCGIGAEALRLLNTKNDGLFYFHRWPLDLRELMAARTLHNPVGEAEVCIQAINRYIEHPNQFQAV